MNAKAIAQLRAESLAATLCAARQRRVRRRVVTVLGGAAGFIVMIIALFPMRDLKRMFTASSRPAPGKFEITQVESGSWIRTDPRSVVRISTVSNMSHIRVSTAPAMKVERIDRDDLRAWFPEKGIAFIQQEAGPAGFVVF